MSHYADRDHISLGQHFLDHMYAMTAEALHDKSDIAAELAWRDQRIIELEGRLDESIRQHEACKRVLNDMGDRVLERTAERDALASRLQAAQNAFRAADGGNDWCDATRESWPVKSGAWLNLEDALFESRGVEKHKAEIERVWLDSYKT